MTKAKLLEIGNINVFPNTKPQVTFLLKKNEDGTLDKVQADFSGWDKEKGIDLKAIKAKPKSGGKEYIRLAITLGEGSNRTFVNGALFVNSKKAHDGQPDYTGTVDLTRDRNGPKLSVAAWNKNGRESGAPFMSLAISEPKGNQDAAAKAPADNASNSVPLDMDNDIPFGM